MKNFIFVSLLMAGCTTFPQAIDILSEDLEPYSKFSLPIVAKEGEVVAYFVNWPSGGFPIDPAKFPKYKMITTVTIGSRVSQSSLPGQYAVFRLNPGAQRIETSSACGRVNKSIYPPDGAIVYPESPGWETRKDVWGLKLTKNSADFNFEAGRTYIFRFGYACYVSPTQGGLVYSSGIKNIEHNNASYFVYKTNPIDIK